MIDSLRNAGFTDISTVDKTDSTLAWFQQMQNSQQSALLNIGNIIGGDVRQMMSNFARNVKEGRARVVQIVAHKAR